MNTHRGSISQIPFACKMFLQCFISKNACRANFNKITAEFIFKSSVFMPPKINMIPGSKNIQVLSSCIVPVKPYTPVTLNAAVHLMIYEWSQFLIIISSFREIVTSVVMTCHDCHILQMTFTSLITHRAIMGMVGHQALQNRSPESFYFRIFN